MTVMSTVFVPATPTYVWLTSGPTLLVLFAPDAGSPKFHEYDVIVEPLNVCVFRALNWTVPPTLTLDGDAVQFGIGFPLTMVTVFDFAFVRPALSVTTRFTAKVPVNGNW